VAIAEGDETIDLNRTEKFEHLFGRARARWWIHLVVIGSYPLLPVILNFGARRRAGPALAHTPRGLLWVCGIQLVVFAAIFVVGWLASRASARDLLLKWRQGFLNIPLGIGYSIALRLGLAIIGVFLVMLLLLVHVVRVENLQSLSGFSRPDVGALVDISALRKDQLYFWLNLTVVSFVVAGLREELWRAAFLAGLRRLWPETFATRPGQIAAVAVAAAIFGCGHIAQGPTGVAAAGLLGLGLGTIMVLHRSIWPAVFAHGLFDATTFAALALLADKLPQLN
jgi:membrane protease YdiL (CAAX protease family)